MLVMSLVLTAYAGPYYESYKTSSSSLAASRLARHIPQNVQKRSPKDMLLMNVYTNSFVGVAGTTQNRKINFHWKDPNSNSTTCCTASWTENNTTSDYPTSYTACDATGNQEDYLWYFASYSSLGNFTLQLAHSFLDPVDFPPPWDEPELFSTVDISLHCISEGRVQGCYMPGSKKVVHAVINGESD